MNLLLEGWCPFFLSLSIFPSKISRCIQMEKRKICWQHSILCHNASEYKPHESSLISFSVFSGRESQYNLFFEALIPFQVTASPTHLEKWFEQCYHWGGMAQALVIKTYGHVLKGKKTHFSQNIRCIEYVGKVLR